MSSYLRMSKAKADAAKRIGAATRKWKLFWSPEGRCIAEVEAPDAKAAVRKAPLPYQKYLGEIYAVEAV